MHDRDDFNHFEKAMVSLKKYKDHINRDVMYLADQTTPLGLLIEELQANQVSSNSDASKRKRHEEFMRGLKMYEIEQREILSMLDTIKKERERNYELDEEKNKHLLEEKKRIERDELELKLRSGGMNNEEYNNFNELLKKLLSDISHAIQEIDKYILQLEEFIEKLENNINNQRKKFLSEFRQEIKTILSGMGVQNGNVLEISVGAKTVPIHIEHAADEIGNIMHQKFESQGVFNQQEFKSEVQIAFKGILIQAAPEVSNELPGQVDEAAKAFSNEVIKRQGSLCEAEHCVDKIERQELEWAKDVKRFVQQAKSNLENYHVDSSRISVDRASLQDLQEKIYLFSQQKEVVSELVAGVDFTQENRRNKMLEARRGRKSPLTPAADPAPAINQQPENVTPRPQ